MAQKNPFDQVAVTAPKYSTFDLSHDHKTSMKMGYLVPTSLIETLPGDTFNIRSEAMFRLMPMVAPIMHKVDVTFHSFFVPNRILWENWEKFIFGGETAQTVNVPPALPQVELLAVPASSLANYLGLPVLNAGAQTGTLRVNALPFAAYHRIYHEFYRDQNLIDAGTDPIMLADGLQTLPVQTELMELRKRAWEHDYFTSALPTAQKGDAVELPIDFQDAPVSWSNPQTPDSRWVDSQGAVVGVSGPLWQAMPTGVTINTNNSDTVFYDPGNTMHVDGDDISVTTTINDLRTAWALQQWLEKNMRMGSRYREALHAHFNVRSSDQRLNRPEYIGGAKGTIAVSEVLQTSESGGATPQGNMAGHGISVMGTGGHRFRCEEHGWIITLVSILPKTAYQQGVARHWFKNDRTLYAWPDFAQLGEQEILNKELYWNAADGQNDGVFGYIPRYAEYRYLPSRVTGQMASTLNHWHMSRIFTTRPQLNQTFIEANPTTRIYAVDDPNEDTLVAQIFTQVIATRPLPVYGIPAPLL